MFILVLTILSLVVMVALLLPLNDATIRLLTVYDNMICVVFLGDFAMNMARSSPKRNYFIGRRGWLDLLGSIPALGFFTATATSNPVTLPAGSPPCWSCSPAWGSSERSRASWRASSSLRRRPRRSATRVPPPLARCRTSWSRSRTDWQRCDCRWLQAAPIRLRPNH